MPINWNAYEREEDDIDEREASGEITREQAQRERRELQLDVQGAHDDDVRDAIRRVDDEYGW